MEGVGTGFADVKWDLVSYYSQPKKEIRLRHMKKQNPTRTVRYPVLHFEKEAAPVKVLKFLPGFFQEAAFPF